MKKIVGLSVLFFILMTQVVFATDFYVRTDGTATSKGAATGCGATSTATSLPWANANISAGDIAYLCDTGGEYTGSEYVAPATSGTSHTNRITYKNALGDTPVIHTGANAYGLYLNGKNWIQVEGITFKAELMGRILGGSYGNYIKDCIFDWRESSDLSSYTGFYVYGNSQYNKFEGSAFYGMQDTVRVGDIFSATDTTNYNYFENCEVAYSTHTSINVTGTQNIIRNSWLHNDAVTWGCWCSNCGCGGRAYGGEGPASRRHLIELNRIAFCEEDDDPATSGAEVGNTDIFRRNLVYANNGYGAQVVNEDGYDPDSLADHSRIYHNTFYYNGVNPAAFKAWRWNGGISNWGDGPPQDTIFKNNIFYDSFGEDVELSASTTGVRIYGTVGTYTITNNFWGWKQGSTNYGDGDPKFTDYTIPVDKSDNSTPDFTLLAISPAIDQSVALTNTNNTGSGSITMSVVDAGYYFDTSPWYIDNPTRGSWMNVPKEYIFVPSWGAPVEITDIDYDNNDLTLASAQDWGSGVGTYSAISSTVGYVGLAPDQGAIEYTVGGDESAPTPNPATISSVSADSVSQLTVNVDAQADATPPIYTEYTLDNTDCGADAGTGGTGCAYQESDSCVDTGLDTNQCYGFKVRHKDSVGTPNVGTYSAVNSTYTLADTPEPPTLTDSAVDTDSQILLQAITADNNPDANPTTQYALYVVGSSAPDTDWNEYYIDTDGTQSAVAVWQSKASWANTEIVGLNKDTTYNIQAIAKNEDGILTAFSTYASYTTTGDYAPPPVVTTIGVTFNGVCINCP